MIAAKTKADPRLEAFTALESAFRDHDWVAFQAAAEELAKTAHEMGADGEEYRPMFKTRKAAPEEPPEAPKPWEVHPMDGQAIRFKQGSVVFTVVRPGGNPASMKDIVAFCDNEENARMIAEALTAKEEK